MTVVSNSRLVHFAEPLSAGGLRPAGNRHRNNVAADPRRCPVTAPRTAISAAYATPLVGLSEPNPLPKPTYTPTRRTIYTMSYNVEEDPELDAFMASIGGASVQPRQPDQHAQYERQEQQKQQERFEQFQEQQYDQYQKMHYDQYDHQEDCEQGPGRKRKSAPKTEVSNTRPCSYS